MSEENEIYKLQKILDESDPYLLEYLYDKSTEELIEYLERLYRELQVIPEDNGSWRERHKRIIKTTEAMYQSKLINQGDSRGGLVIG